MDGLEDDWISEPRSSTISADSQLHLQNNTSTSSFTSQITTAVSKKDLYTDSSCNPVTQGDNHQQSTGISTIPGTTSHTSSSNIPTFSQPAAQEQQSTMQVKPRKENIETNTPEWKKRIVRGELPAGESGDLFAPMRLESVFKPPTGSESIEQTTLPTLDSSNRLFSGDFNLSSSNLISRYRGFMPDDSEMKTGSSNSQGDTTWMEHMSEEFPMGTLDSISSAYIRHIEPLKNGLSALRLGRRDATADSRMRTVSGLEELRNENISPISLPKRNSLHDVSSRNVSVRSQWQDRRASSPASDSFFLEATNTDANGYFVGDDSIDMTSHSLPEGLSMGTQDLIAAGGFVNSRRGGYFEDASFHRRELSLSPPPSQFYSSVNQAHAPLQPFTPNRSLTPPMPNQPSPDRSDERPRSGGSPLKLFGQYDTFTNDKLLRRMSQFEDDSKPRFDRRSFELDERSGSESIEDSAILEPMEYQGDTQETPLDIEKAHSNHSSSEGEEQPERTRMHRSRRKSVYSPSKNLEVKRLLNSPTKGSAPKRRRTLQISEKQDEPWPEPILDSSGFISDDFHQSKLFDFDVENAGAETVSQTFQSSKPSTPKSTNSRKTQQRAHSQSSSISEGFHETLSPSYNDTHNFPIVPFNIKNPMNESRKGSITTQDFLNEATKIMDIIRAKGRPANNLASLDENGGTPNEDNFTTYTDESSQERFSRPPSRDGVDLRTLRIQPEPHPRIVSHLKKFEDKDEFDLVMSSSMRSLRLKRDDELPETPFHADFDETMETSPNTLRRIVENEDPAPSHEAAQRSAESIPTRSSRGSSGSSGVKGMISSEMVSHLIPTRVGGMAYDRNNQTWIKARKRLSHDSNSRTGTVSDEDPFGDITDLSVDEIREVKTAQDASPAEDVGFETELAETPTRKGVKDSEPQGSKQAEDDFIPRVKGSVPALPSDSSSVQSKYTQYTSSGPKPGTRATSWASEVEELPEEQPQAEKTSYPTSGNEAVHNGLPDGYPSPATSPVRDDGKQARVVTITLPSPVVSQNLGDSQGREEVIQSPPQDKNEGISDIFAPETLHPQSSAQENNYRDRNNGRPDISTDLPQDLSIILPPDDNDQSLAPAVTPCRSTQYSFHLSPLPEFTLNQIDESLRLEVSYIAERTNRTSLRQIHGTLSLAAEDLVKHLTDAEPYEAFWEQLRRLSLRGKGLITLHQLHKYCSRLEELDLSENQLGQLSGIPASVRTLSVSHNCLSSLTSWGHLSNLQYLDISNNSLDNLDSLSGLVHLRSLKANNNKLKCIKGIFRLDGLLTLKAQQNQLTSVNFKNAELTRLNKLDLRGNQLSSVENIDRLQELETLDLRNNQLQCFIVSDAMPEMHSLKLSNNALKSLDVSPCPLLHLLYVDCNQLSTVDGLAECPTLDTLSMREQTSAPGRPKLITLDMNDMHSLRKLFLSSNILSTDTISPSMPTPNLQLLDLASCTLESLPIDFGRNFPGVKSLNLNFNALSEISGLQGITRLNRLSIVGNRISRLRRLCQILRRVGGEHGSLTRIDLRGNPLTVGFYPSPISGSGRLLTHDNRTDTHTNQPPSNTQEHKQLVQMEGDEGEEGDPLPTLGGGTDITHRNNHENLNNYADCPFLSNQNHHQNLHPHSLSQQSTTNKPEIDDPYTIPHANSAMDSKYLIHLDEPTRLRRRVVELMIHASTAGRLKYLDGLAVSDSQKDVGGGGDGNNAICATSGSGSGGNGDGNGKARIKKDWVWNRLQELGVLKKRVDMIEA